MGDLNAQIGQKEIHKSVVGKHSLHERSNDNGVKLINFAISRGMNISSTQFPERISINIHGYRQVAIYQSNRSCTNK
jgi:hypothetical protein